MFSVMCNIFATYAQVTFVLTFILIPFLSKEINYFFDRKSLVKEYPSDGDCPSELFSKVNVADRPVPINKLSFSGAKSHMIRFKKALTWCDISLCT